MKFLTRLKGISNDENRRDLVARAVEEARGLYAAGSLDQAREVILRLRDRFDDAGLDRLELLYAAHEGAPEDSYWLSAITETLLSKQSVTSHELGYLLKAALASPTRLELWTRLLREARGLGDHAALGQIQEECSIALARYFPDWETSHWEGGGLADEAMRIFHASLSRSVDSVMAQNRTDPRARLILEAARAHFPDHQQAMVQLARIVCQAGERDSKQVALVMEALLYEPNDRTMKLWVAETLMQMPRHSQEGMAMLRQLQEEQPSDPLAEEKLVSALKGSDGLEERDLPLVQRWLARNQTDQRALELLADWYAQRGSVEDEALKLYRLAVKQSPRRMTYLRLLGKSSASRAEWGEVLEAFEEMYRGGDTGEDVVLPLAAAYVSFERADALALEVYRAAIKNGSRNPDVHNVYCRHLYQTAPAAADSVAQFAGSLVVAPDVIWAQLGMARHYLMTGDYQRTMDGAVELLVAQPDDLEAMDLAGKALAGDFSRRQLARLAKVEPRSLRRIYEAAYKEQPDAGPIVTGLARRRLADGLRDAETARLLREACRRNPEMMDLRLEWGELLWQMGEIDNSCGLLRELLMRWRTTLPAGVTPEKRAELLIRVAGHLVRKPSADDLEVLVDAVAEPTCPPKLLVSVAKAILEVQANHPSMLAIAEKAIRHAPEDPVLERAVAEGRAATGKPVPALKLACQLIRSGHTGDEVVSLLRTAHAANRPQDLTAAMLDDLREAMDRTEDMPAVTLLAGMELIFSVRPADTEDLTILERLAEMLPRNVRVRRWLARGMSAVGLDTKAAELYDTLRGSSTADSELHAEMARTHARLGMYTRDSLRVARAAVDSRPRDMELAMHLGATFLALGMVQEATEKFEQVLLAEPNRHPQIGALIEGRSVNATDSSRLLPLMTRIHIKAERYEKALNLLGRMQQSYQHHFGDMITLYGELIAAMPDNPRPLIERGILFRLAGQLDEAVEDLAGAHRMVPDSEDILHEYADLLAQKARHGETDAAFCVEAANLFLRLGEEGAAMELANLGMRRPGNTDPAVMLRARIELQSGMLGECRETLTKLQDRSRGIQLFEQLARTYADRSDFLRAAEVLTDAIEAGGSRQELLEQMRDLYQQQNHATQDASMRRRLLNTLSHRAQGRYELREEIGSGAMGVVFKAYDRELDEIVVLKILPEHFAEDQEALARFRHEAKAARKLAHPHIIRIHDFGEESGRKHISMEYVSGGDLKEYLRKAGGQLPLPEALRIVREVTRALAHAHGEGVLHRDIKTANILLTPSGRVKLSDFGIAALLGPDVEPPPDDPDYVLGTPLYMSPEQFRGEAVTPASDLYSVGVLFYELLAGRTPFTRGSIAYHHQFTAPDHHNAISEEVWSVISHLLAKKPRDRFRSAEELLMALDGL